jgi:glycosyltransferase involved in cell wall biosynthesis
VRYLSHGLLGGVHTYVYSLVSELAALNTDHLFFLYADTKRPFELENLPSNFTVRLLRWRNKLDSVKADLTLRQAAAQDNLDVMHYPANYGFGPSGVPTLITLHDALNIFPLWESIKRDLKKPKTVAQTLYLQALTRLSASRATRFITVSNWSARNISEVSRGKIPLENIEVIYSAPGANFRPFENHTRLEEIKQKLKLPNKFVLADGLKNPGVILRAWERLPEYLQKEYKIIFFSRRADLLPVAQKAIQEGRANLLLRPTDEELVALYNLATLFLFPSWIEGFGLPILEAMGCGAPVVASDRGSIPEIGGEAALYHDAEDDEKLAEYLKDLLGTPEKREQLRAMGFKRANEFSWRKAALELLEVYARYSRSKSDIESLISIRK